MTQSLDRTIELPGEAIFSKVSTMGRMVELVETNPIRALMAGFQINPIL